MATWRSQGVPRSDSDDNVYKDATEMYLNHPMLRSESSQLSQKSKLNSLEEPGRGTLMNSPYQASEFSVSSSTNQSQERDYYYYEIKRQRRASVMSASDTTNQHLNKHPS